ncbi:ATPase-like protein [Clostridium carboxidivorans P7]|uniref:ATPase-like protein n=1 Tax=Clostridium carboxidivorans P7 TaxID=536227 RepID=C6Q1E3_9CLOT|nr:ATPase-like protein [Clostridium carboxidivorans P7]
MNPLANKIRPKNLDEVIGQKHLLGEGKILQDMISSGHLMNMIFLWTSRYRKNYCS